MDSQVQVVMMIIVEIEIDGQEVSNTISKLSHNKLIILFIQLIIL